MAAIDLTKLEKFVEAAISNSNHPVYKAGWSKSSILQHYATNVHMLGAIKPQDWFAQYPDSTIRLNEVMVYCETEQAKVDAEKSEEQKLRADVDNLTATLATLRTQIASLTPAPATQAPAADAPNAAA